MKLKTTVALDQEEILNIVRAHLENKGYELVTDLEVRIQDSVDKSNGPLHGEFVPAKIKSISAQVEKIEK